MDQQDPQVAAILEVLRFGRLTPAVRQAQEWLTSGEPNPAAHLLLGRCFYAQGRFRRAAAAYEQALREALPASNIITEARLRAAILCLPLDSDADGTVKTIEAIAAELHEQPEQAWLQALAQELLGRALGVAVEWHVAQAGELNRAKQLLSTAVETYRAAGDEDSALAVLIGLADLCLLTRSADRDAAKVVLARAELQAIAAGNGVRHGQAVLALAGLQLEDSLGRLAATGGESLDLARYDEALTLYEAAGYEAGPADVLLSSGTRLLNAGLDARAQVQQALELHRQQGNLRGLLDALTALRMWHLRRGDVEPAMGYQREMTLVVEEMDFAIGRASIYLGIAEYYFRGGDYSRALEAYSRIEAMVVPPASRALAAIQLASIYSKMNMGRRAEASARHAIAILTPAGPTDRISLAYYVLGNALSAEGRWAEAVAAWRTGLTIDEALHDPLAQAEKLIAIAQATSMQHYQPQGPPVPDGTYEESMRLYGEAIDLLQGIGTAPALAVVANTFQLKAQTAVTCAKLDDALAALEQAREIYASLDMAMQTAFTDAHLGLACYGMAKQGHYELYDRAAECWQQALDYFYQAEMRDLTWQVQFYMALTRFRQGVLAPSAVEQQSLWHLATVAIDAAAGDIDLVRGRFIKPVAVDRAETLLSLVADKEKVYVFAVQMHQHFLHDPIGAYEWLERMKSRAFLDLLALTELRAPRGPDEELLVREALLLAQLHQATSQPAAVRLSRELHEIWDQLGGFPEAAEYVALRRGLPLSYPELRKLLD